MKKKFVLAVALLMVNAAITALAAYHYTGLPPVGSRYLTYRDGGESKLLLLNSRLSYGVYEEGFSRGSYHVYAGEACIIINGTVRNDYEKDYYFSITADAYNSEDELMGPVLTIDSPMPRFTVVYAERGCKAYFGIRIPYKGEDITRYELYLAYPPTETPPP